MKKLCKNCIHKKNSIPDYFGEYIGNCRQCVRNMSYSDHYKEMNNE